MEGLDLTKMEVQRLLNLVEQKSIKVVDPELFGKYRELQTKLLDYLSGPGLDLGGEE